MPKDPVLVVIDVQQGFRDSEFWGPSGNPEALGNIDRLVQHFRSRKLPIVVVKHNSANPDSPLSPSSSGNALEPFLDGQRDVLVQKSVNSAFYGTPDLHLWLTKRNFRNLVICGITTNFCCETTARMAANLGYQTTFISDATDAFDLELPSGGYLPAAQVIEYTNANLGAEFAEVISTEQALGRF